MLADTQHTHKDAKDVIHDSCASFLQLWYLEPALVEYGNIFFALFTLTMFHPSCYRNDKNMAQTSLKHSAQKKNISS